MLKTVGFPSTRTGDQTIVNGNLVIGTAGKGIDFSADPNPGGMTSELLDDYEEGTWTPALGGDTTYTTQIGKYVKVGAVCTIVLSLTVNVLGTGSTTTIFGLPFQAAASAGSASGAVAYAGNLAANFIGLTFRIDSGVNYIDNTVMTIPANTTTPNVAIFGNGAIVLLSITYITV